MERAPSAELGTCSPQLPPSRYPDILPKFQVDRGAIRFVLSGANIMAPGLTSAGGKMDDVPEGTTVAIFAEGNEVMWKARPTSRLMLAASIHGLIS